MGRIAGIQIKNYGSLKNIKLGKLLGDNSGRELTNMNAIIGQSGTGKSTLADAFGFLADCMEKGVETACDLNNRGGYESIISQGVNGSIEFIIVKQVMNHLLHMNCALGWINMKDPS